MRDELVKLCNHKAELIFVGGIAAGLLGKKIIESEKTKEVCSKAMAQVLMAKDSAEEAFQEMKEEAESINSEE